MILIFSVNDDYSTTRVINWLISLKKEFIRINENTNVKLVSLTAQEFIISVDGRNFHSAEITKIWYRRGDINFFKQFDSLIIKKYLSTESASLSAFMRYRFDKIESVNNFRTRDINKLYLLDLCKKNDLLVPNFIVTSERETLTSFYEKEKNIISKPLNTPFTIIGVNRSVYQSYTAEITLDDISQLSEKFTPTFFQKNIVKEYEIRCFYLKGKFYAMAIFSQKNKNTHVDFRNYDYSKPNRVTPYEFPKSYEKEIKRLLDKIGLNCASFDVILSKEDQQYYFLDLNPIGQFGMVSDPCNYNLEKEIALSL